MGARTPPVRLRQTSINAVVALLRPDDPQATIVVQHLKLAKRQREEALQLERRRRSQVDAGDAVEVEAGALDFEVVFAKSNLLRRTYLGGDLIESVLEKCFC